MMFCFQQVEASFPDFGSIASDGWKQGFQWVETRGLFEGLKRQFL
jgi:hypothetical protein